MMIQSERWELCGILEPLTRLVRDMSAGAFMIADD
jgi:hypothetical protein